MRSFFFGCALALSGNFAWCDSLQKLELQAEGHTWTYHLYVPLQARSSGAPLVLVFHGAGGSGKDYLTKNGWIDLSEKEGFIVAAPDGLPALPRMPANFRMNPRLWNSGQLNANMPRAKINDIAFVKSLLVDIAYRANIDKNRIYATGHSNGAGMTFKIGAEMPTHFAAIATVMGLNTSEGARPNKALPTLMLIGTQDPLNPIAGGERQLPWGKSTVPPVAQGIHAWSQSLHCTTAAVQERDDDQVSIESFKQCRDGAFFSIWFIKGQGHAWPGGQDSGLPASVMGPNLSQVNTTDLIWQFFSGLPH